MSRSPGSRSRTCHLISLSATHMHVRHADIPGIPIIPYHLASHHYSHGAPDRSVISSESIFSRILLPVTSGFQPSPFELPKDCLSRLITDQANATPARLSSTRLHRVLKHAHSHLFRHEPADLPSHPSLPLSYAQCPSSRRHMQTRIGSPYYSLNGYHTPELAPRKTRSLTVRKVEYCPPHTTKANQNACAKPPGEYSRSIEIVM